MHGLAAAYSDAIGMLLCLQRAYIASLMIVSVSVPICQAVIRKFVKKWLIQQKAADVEMW